MEIYLNGKTTAVTPECSLFGLITELGLNPDTVIAELNRDIVPSSQFETTMLKPGDALELLHLVGGG